MWNKHGTRPVVAGKGGQLCFLGRLDPLSELIAFLYRIRKGTFIQRRLLIWAPPDVSMSFQFPWFADFFGRLAALCPAHRLPARNLWCSPGGSPTIGILCWWAQRSGRGSTNQTDQRGTLEWLLHIDTWFCLFRPTWDVHEGTDGCNFEVEPRGDQEALLWALWGQKFCSFALWREGDGLDDISFLYITKRYRQAGGKDAADACFRQRGKLHLMDGVPRRGCESFSMFLMSGRRTNVFRFLLGFPSFPCENTLNRNEVSRWFKCAFNTSRP